MFVIWKRNNQPKGAQTRKREEAQSTMRKRRVTWFGHDLNKRLRKFAKLLFGFTGAVLTEFAWDLLPIESLKSKKNRASNKKTKHNGGTNLEFRHKFFNITLSSFNHTKPWLANKTQPPKLPSLWWGDDCFALLSATNFEIELNEWEKEKRKQKRKKHL
jgi:hypothetical protein